MTGLAELQAQFKAYLLERDRRLERLTVGSERLPAADRLAVYSNAYRLRLLEILAEDFPGVRGLAGNETFDALGSAYIEAHPSSHPSVRWFGRCLAAFLRDTSPWREQPHLAEMAAFEWMQGEVMDAADSDTVTAGDLGGLAVEDWPAMRIGFQAAMRRLDLRWNVPVAWQAIRNEEPPPSPAQAARPVPWLLWRRNLEVHWRSLEEDEAYTLDTARDGAAFGDVCEGLLARTHDDQVPLRAAGFLKRWVLDELVARIDVRRPA